MRGLAVAVAACAALVATGSSAGTSVPPVQKKALAAISKALASGRIDGPTAATARGEIARAARLIRGLPAGRGAHVSVALSELAAFNGRLTLPRALALVGQLKANDDYFAVHWAPADKTDITDADGIVYRYFAGRCFELHPLADFGALNARIAAGDADATERLADALIARGVYQHTGGVGWEYYFDFSGGRAPWLSGMAQAVAAQAFARAATLVPDRSTAYLRAAHNAFALIPHMLTSVAAGPWIRLYTFQSLPVLNAQLQTVISLKDYADATEDSSAEALAVRMQNAAAATLPKFDTGYWTYYSLPHEPSPVDYQQYVVQLLARLAPADPRFAAARTRFAAYLKQPPAFMVANGGLGTLRVWVSKPSSVQVNTPAGPTRRVSLFGGWATLPGKEPTRAGIYPVRVTAVDWAGNRATFDALPIVRVAGTPAKTGAARKSADATATPTPTLAVGAALDDPSQAANAQKLGLRVVRLGVAWPSGSGAPDPGLVAALQRVPSNEGIVVELAASPLPADDAGRSVLAQYAASLAQQVPQLRDVLLTPPPTAAAAGAAAYVAALAAIRNAVQAVVSTVAVGPLIDGATAPRATVAALGRAFAALGASAPYVDVVALRPAPAPATTAQWTEANVAQLVTAATSAFGGTAPPVLIDGLATATTVPAAELGAYAGGPPPTAGAVAPTTQATDYASDLNALACSPSVAGVILDRLQDSPTAPVPATGLYYAGGTAKPSAAAVAAAAVPAQRGAVVCPGLETVAGASFSAFPSALTSGAATSFQLGCTRDCLYVATLEGVDGKPVAAARGALAGGAAPTTVTLPKAKLGAGQYTIDVRLSSQVNPGTVAQLTSGPLPVG